MLTDLANEASTLRERALALHQAMVALGITIGALIDGLVVEEYGARACGGFGRAGFLCYFAGDGSKGCGRR